MINKNSNPSCSWGDADCLFTIGGHSVVTVVFLFFVYKLDSEEQKLTIDSPGNSNEAADCYLS